MYRDFRPDTLPGGLRHFLFWLLLNNIINMEIHYHPEFFFIFYSQKLGKKFHKKQVKLENKLHYPKNIYISKNSKKLQWVLSKKEKEKKREFLSPK
jgi:hypothetical protein